MKARDVMTPSPVTVGPETSVREIAKLLLERRISAVPVVDPGLQVLGLVSERDLMRRPESQTERTGAWWLALFHSAESDARDYVRSHGQYARQVMSAPAITVEEGAELNEIAEVLESNKIKRVPVVRDGRLVGIVSRADLLRGLATPAPRSAAPLDDAALRSAVLQEIDRAGLKKTFVSVTVSDGVAHLWGAVESAAEKEALQVAAAGVPGLKGVEDRVNVFSRRVSTVLWGE